jgi:hypothetical protein
VQAFNAKLLTIGETVGISPARRDALWCETGEQGDATVNSFRNLKRDELVAKADKSMQRTGARAEFIIRYAERADRQIANVICLTVTLTSLTVALLSVIVFLVGHEFAGK